MISRRPKSKRLCRQAMHLRSQAQPAIDHYLAQLFDVIRQASDKQYPLGKRGNSRSQFLLERQVVSQFFCDGSRAAGAYRPKCSEDVKSAKPLKRIPQRGGRIEEQPFDPERPPVGPFDRGRKTERPLRPLLRGRLSAKQVDLPTNRRRAWFDLQPKDRLRVGRVIKDIFLRKPVESRSLFQADGGLLAASLAWRFVPFSSGWSRHQYVAVCLKIDLDS